MEQNKSQTILVVDNVEINRLKLAEIFSDEYNVAEAFDCDEALEMLKARGKSISVVVLDLYMTKAVAETVTRTNAVAEYVAKAEKKTEAESLDFIAEIKRTDDISDIPVVVFTHGADAENIVKALDLGASDVIIQPFNTKIVKQRVKNIINHGELEQIKEQNRILKIEREADERHNFELRLWAEIDYLTGVYNKRAFLKYTRHMLEKNRDTEYALMRWNIERFKVVNDIFGTDAGDKILTKIAKKLSLLFPDDGICGRIDADHFVICFPVKMLDIDALFSEMERYIDTFHYDFKIMLGAGIYLIKDISISIDLMCDRAKLALNTISGNFLKRYAYYNGTLMEDLRKEQHIINEMYAALEQNQFDVYLQPQYNHATGKIVGAEALARWNHPHQGVIQPNVFIPLFEQNGFIIKLDEYICERACMILREWIDNGHSPVPVSVNISRMDIYHLKICKILLDMLKKYDLNVSMLKLEITETAYMENPKQLIGVVQELQSHGFIVQMDDFGSGYSSLNMLHDVPFDVLKLDLKFLYGDKDTGRSGNILNSIVSMAKSLNIPVIAEGVETRPQADYLKDIGCELVQGYYYGKPVPARNFNDLLLDE